MKKTVYVLPDSPTKGEFQTWMKQLTPELNDVIREQLEIAFDRLKTRVRERALRPTQGKISDRQTISNGTHTITLIARLQPPSIWERIFK